tara:strand:+ start:496 stop:747 length:252 start_codon:yes stop_codon:yes gene_type:complete
MTQAQLRKLGFKKVFIDEEDDNHFYYEHQFGEITFISGDNDQAEEDGSWYVTTPCQSLGFYAFNEVKTLIDLFNRNKISENSI